jgi:phosphate transport system permease protein
MTATTSAPQTPVTESPVAPVSGLRGGHLPSWAPWAILGASAALSAALFGIMALGGAGGFNVAGWAVVTAILYLILITVTSTMVTAFAIAMVPLVSVAVTVVTNGINGISAEFFSSSMRNVVGEGGGALHAIVGTLMITLAAAVISIPIGIFTAIYLIEYGAGRRLAQAITFLVDVMTGIPSIVAGLFAYALFALIFGPGIRMGIMGAIALSVLMIPVVVRSTEEMLRLVPNELREASYALGVPKWLTISKVVLPTAVAGITTGVMLSISRVIGETAPLLLTAGVATSVNYDLFSGRMMTLPVFAYSQYMNQGIPATAFVDRAWGAALVLIVIVMVLNLVARVVAKIFSPKLGR